MSQMETISWTNANPAVALNKSVGFEVARITVIDQTNGGSFQWNDQMAVGSVLDVDSGVVGVANGFTPLAQQSTFGCAISAFTNANPGVITASNIAEFGVAAGDTVKIVAVADDLTGATLNFQDVVASVTGTTITLTKNTSAYAVYVSGGFVFRVSDVNGDPIPTQNKAIHGITLGTSCVGAASAVMSAVIEGKNCVV
jgi:hypothetical protein